MNVLIKRERLVRDFATGKSHTVTLKPRRPNGRLKNDIQRPPSYRGTMRRSILADHNDIRKQRVTTKRRDINSAVFHIRRDVQLPTDLVARLLGYGVNVAALKRGALA